MKASKSSCVALVGALVIGCAFAAQMATAQTQPPPPPTAQTQPPPPPGPPPPPAQTQPPPPPGPPPPPPPGPTQTIPAPIVSEPYQPTRGDRVGAGFLNIVYVPGKAIVCSAGTIASAGLMLLTFGSAYHAAVDIFNEGCGGKWVLTPYDVAAKRPPEDQY